MELLYKHLWSLGTLSLSKQEDKESEECDEGVNVWTRKARKAFEGMNSLPSFFPGKICSSRGWKRYCKKPQKPQGQALTSSQTAAEDRAVAVAGAGNISSHCILAGWLPSVISSPGPSTPSISSYLPAGPALPPAPADAAGAPGQQCPSGQGKESWGLLPLLPSLRPELAEMPVHT